MMLQPETINLLEEKKKETIPLRMTMQCKRKNEVDVKLFN